MSLISPSNSMFSYSRRRDILSLKKGSFIVGYKASISGSSLPFAFSLYSSISTFRNSSFFVSTWTTTSSSAFISSSLFTAFASSITFTSSTALAFAFLVFFGFPSLGGDFLAVFEPSLEPGFSIIICI